jgi:aldose 1-epimerase
VTPLLLKTKASRATVLPQRGGLVSSLYLGSANRDLLWLPQNFDETASSWPGGGLPLLFPFAGRVWHQGELYRYKVGESVYPMPLHGFSWAAKWSVVEHSSDRAVLELRDDENSRGIFPFKFLLRLTITLSENDLTSAVHVTNQRPLMDADAMPVALGWHPYLRLTSGLSELSIPAGVIHPVTGQGGAGKPESTLTALGPSPWTLPHERLQSLILSDLERSTAMLNHGPDIQAVEIASGPTDIMRHMVTWTNEPKSFHCVEPWMSLPDAVATPTGCRWLKPGETLDAWIKISTPI